MRPRKSVLIWTNKKRERLILGFVLNVWGYNALTAATLAEAQAAIAMREVFLAIALGVTHTRVRDLALVDPKVPILVIVGQQQTSSYIEFGATGVIREGDLLGERLRAVTKTMTARKSGPKPVVRLSQPVVERLAA